MSALLNAAGAAVSTAARLEAFAALKHRARRGDAVTRELAVERDGAISAILELGLHLRAIGLDHELALVYSQMSCIAASLSYGTFGAGAAEYNAKSLRVFGMRLSIRRPSTPAVGASAG